MLLIKCLYIEWSRERESIHNYRVAMLVIKCLCIEWSREGENLYNYRVAMLIMKFYIYSSLERESIYIIIELLCS